MKTISNETIQEKFKLVKEARHLYTYDGLLNQIEKWFRDPFGPTGGYLSCKSDDRKELIAAAISLH